MVRSVTGRNSGRKKFCFAILKTGRLVIPSAVTVDDAIGYLQGLYLGYDGLFTAYYVGVPEDVDTKNVSLEGLIVFVYSIFSVFSNNSL